MVSLIGAVVVGYLVMAVFVMAAFSLALVAPDLAFEAGSFDVTPGWLAYTLVASLAAAAAGGFAAAAVGRTRAVRVLAVLVVVVGLSSAVNNLRRERPAATDDPSSLSVTERAMKAVQPTWYAFTLPFLAAAGVLLGGLIRGHERAVQVP
jgi:hypothetical protein